MGCNFFVFLFRVLAKLYPLCPHSFLICPETGRVLEIPVVEIIKDKSKIIFDNNGKKLEISILDGNCKLQWKVDWAMRWFALDVDFEMYGKDLIESAILSKILISNFF